MPTISPKKRLALAPSFPVQKAVNKMINDIRHIENHKPTPLTFCNGDYNIVMQKWNALLKNQKINALKKAHIYHNKINLKNISYYTKKVALKAVGLL